MQSYSKLDKQRKKYLELLSYRYRNREQVSAKIISLKAILNMPKATEHFVSDIHGEYDSFSHVVKNASGVIKNYVEELFSTRLSEYEKKELATLCYYPEEKLNELTATKADLNDFYKKTLLNMIEMTRRVGSKYAHSKIQASYPADMAHILDELLYENPNNRHKDAYYNELINEIIRLGMAKQYITTLATLTQRFAVEYLHVIGDIYDRGDNAFDVMEFLQNHHSADIQWGNHDIAWIGAHAGSEALILNVLRIAARYDNLSTLEDDYGINLMPLATLANELYEDDACEIFAPKTSRLSKREISLISKIHKTVAIMQFKAEGQLIARHPEYKMDKRAILGKLCENNTKVYIDGQCYDMKDSNFPSINPENPYAFSIQESAVMEKLVESFRFSPKLREHIRFMVNSGAMYKIANDNLLFHGCIPMNDDGSFRTTDFLGIELSDKSLMDKLDYIVRMGIFTDNKKSREWAIDVMWYMWCGADSPLFGKDKMTTFERYFIADKATHHEQKDAYFNFRDSHETVDMILSAFGINSAEGRIINGHVPVKVSSGESPIKANGRVINIDGGFSKAYQPVTGIAGYTLISNSYGILLAAHEPFVEKSTAISENIDVTTSTEFVVKYKERRRVSATDLGENIREKIRDLYDLFSAYNEGIFIENSMGIHEKN